MKYLYKYPQREFPYGDLVETNARRSREEFEYELLDTGIFDDDRYFDVFVEYAKAAPDDIADPLHGAQSRSRGGAAARAADAVVPQHVVLGRRHGAKPVLLGASKGTIVASHRRAGQRTHCPARARASCCSPRTRATTSGSGVSRVRART